MVFIKKILIQGFKSYKELLDLESFSSRHNVIVGRNGSGKSNFFFAIRFVLSDLFTNLRADERQALLHEGAGVNVMSAFVEIHFDNSDRRFPIDREEVVLRRQIGLKKDEYSLDKKHVTKHDVVNLLEAAGFSRSNPYYIVQQGKVNALTMMKDAERLELLKEVAGTRVYDERREESLKIIKETSGRREKIEEVLAYIEERLRELEEEQAELKAYQELDREHRAIKYTIYEKELEDATQGLAKLESSRNEESSKAKEEYQHVLRAHRKIKESERDIKELEVELRRLQKEKEEIEEERQDSIKARAKLELYVEEASRKVESDQKAQALLSEEAETLNAEIENTKARLEELQPLFKEALDSERALSERLMDCERRTNELYSKQGRSARFNNKKERDSWIRKEIKQIDRNIEAQRQQIDVLQKELDQMQKRREDGAASIQQTQRKLEDIRRLVEKNNKSYNERKLERDELSNRRKELWRQDTDNDAAIQTLKTELIKVERQLQSTVNKITAIGLSAVTRLATEHGIRGVYGPLIELFDCPEEFMTAVEVTAGGSLFHVVVDSDRVASQLIDLLNEEGIAGRVTFMPLNRLNPEVPSALVESEDARPLIDQITFNPMFRSAFLQVFGKTLICLNIEVATGLAQTRNLNCVTVDGDQVNRKGALTGGFYDVRHSRLEAMKSIKAYKAKLKDLVAAAEKIKASAQETDQAVSNVLGQMQQLEVRGAKNRDTYEQLSLDLRLLMKDEEALRSTIEQKEQSVAELTMSLRQLEEARRSLEAELGTELLAQLRPQEQTELRQLNEEIQQKKNDLLVSAAQRAELETKKNALQNLLSANLLKRQAEINEEIGSLALVEAKVQLQQRQHDLGLVQTSVQESSQRLKEIDRQIDEKNTRVRDLRTAIDDLKATENKYAQQMQAESKTMEKLLNKRSLLLQKSEECMNKIRELGSRPSSVENYRGIERKELLRALDETSRKLQNYSKVNKKAGDQYVSFTQQHSELLRKKKEADEAAQKIEELIQVLDARKDAAIERTFKGVARHFQEVFSELVPAGSGLLVMQKGKDGQQARTGDEGEQAAGRISQYTGVAIKVSFTKSAETQHMQFLSGGQKSLVALALIFAIQRCDPAPFYLFDEIDSALDPEHRAAVANMIKKQSGKAQFITTTFRPELVATAKKHYGITFKNKVSTIKAIKKAKALEIIHAEAEQEQQRGETTLQLPVTPLLLHPPPRDDEPEEEEQVDRTGQ